MKFTVMEPLEYLSSSIEVTSAFGEFILLKHLDISGSEDSINMTTEELYETIMVLRRSNKYLEPGSIPFWAVASHKIETWGKNNSYYFNLPNQNKRRIVSKGYIVLLLQEILGCPGSIDRVSYQTIGEVLYLSEGASDPNRQVRRYRKNALDHIASCYQKLRHLNAENKLQNIVLYSLFSSFKDLETAYKNSKSSIIVSQRKKIEAFLSAMSTLSLKHIADKICGHILKVARPPIPSN
ncbi:hypothetical protein BCT07_10865 [Vibrio breoganii]|uniref:hypothetical protein n=1 Tax=Vibrio breoganii TaxID=553239 RepID=UPI000C867CA2|nr:hypothetical protein [Vibrio breoganii]PMO58747.1 hypothetical protein BCT07_10865 [Vibrio breoganii]